MAGGHHDGQQSVTFPLSQKGPLGSGTLPKEPCPSVVLGKDKHVSSCLKHSEADVLTDAVLEIKAEFYKNRKFW